MKERRLVDDYFDGWNFPNDSDEEIIFRLKGKQHKVTVRCGKEYPFIIFRGKRYFFY